MTQEPEIWDGAWKLVDFDHPTGRSVWMTQQDDQLVFRVDMPLEDIFSANHEMAMETQGRRFGDYNRVASIPHHLVYQNGIDDALGQGDDKWLARWLNDSDNRKFRTSRGRV